MAGYTVDDSGVYMLLLAPAEADKELPWSHQSLEAPESSVTDGKANTDAMVEMGGFEAAEYCASYGHGYHLPSQAELSTIFANNDKLGADALFDWVWSSTQYSANNARYMNASSGSWSHYYKYDSYRVRPVRRIKLAE